MCLGSLARYLETRSRILCSDHRLEVCGGPCSPRDALLTPLVLCFLWLVQLHVLGRYHRVRAVLPLQITELHLS